METRSVFTSIGSASRDGSIREGSGGVAKSRDWTKVIERLNQSGRGEMRIQMGSPGSAQVTRVRLLDQWSNLEASTAGATLILRLPPA